VTTVHALSFLVNGATAAFLAGHHKPLAAALYAGISMVSFAYLWGSDE
jgi:hypothetical protein